MAKLTLAGVSVARETCGSLSRSCGMPDADRRRVDLVSRRSEVGRGRRTLVGVAEGLLVGVLFVLLSGWLTGEE
jgi:hypothetical protein